MYKRVVEKMAVTDSDQQDDARGSGTNDPKILRGKVDSLTLYEITDAELDALERGSPSSTYLNLAILCLSVGISFLISILTTDISDRVFIGFFIVAAVGLCVGAVLFVIWWRMGSELSGVCRKIRERVVN